MRWVRFSAAAAAPGALPRLGVLCAGGVVDVERTYARYRAAGGREEAGVAVALAAGSLTRWIRCAAGGAFATWLLNHADVADLPQEAAHLCAPLADPARFVCVGLNYRAHAREIGQPYPPSPPLFAKWSNSIVGPNDPIVRPRGCCALDYEGELGVVIGRRVRDISVSEALDAVFGYTIVDDVSARDWQFRTSQWLAGKVADSFAPLGPAVVERRHIPDPQALTIRTWVNGELRQDGATSDMIFGVAALVSILSTITTLEAGDLIATGTPGGVGMSAQPPRYLNPGDRVRIEIGGIGSLDNTVTDAPRGPLRAGHEGDYIQQE